MVGFRGTNVLAGRADYHVEGAGVANNSSITIRVYAARGGSHIQFTSKGRYISFPTNGYQRDLVQQPIQPTASLSAFWQSVLNEVLANIQANP